MEILFIFLILGLILIIFISKKKPVNDQQRSIEMDVPNPSKAKSERVLRFIDNQPIEVIDQVYSKFKKMDLDFNGLEKYYFQKINGNFKLEKALKETNKEVTKVPKDVDFDHFKTKKVPSKAYLTSSKIPRKLLTPKKDLENTSHFFYGKKIVISGTFENFPYRAEIAKMLWEIGADVDTAVNQRTDFLLSGNGVGPSKLQKAENFGAEIIDENQFLTYFPDYETTFN